MDIYLIKQGWYWEVISSFYELWLHNWGNFFLTFIEGYQKLSFETSYNDFWLFSCAQAPKKCSKINLNMTKNCQNGDLIALEAYFSLNGLKYNILMVLDTSYSKKLSSISKNTLEPLNCCIYHYLPCFNWIQTTFFTLGHFKIVTYHHNRSQMKTFNVPLGIL